MHKSIIRDGNHFIYIDGAGWVLIDGPWFDKLNTARNRTLPERLRQTPAEPPLIPGMKSVTWERQKWQSGPGRFHYGWRLPDGHLPPNFYDDASDTE